MQGFVKDIESITVENEDFRRVLYTSKNCQLVVMTLKPDEEIGEETHARRSVLSLGGRHGRGDS